MVVRIALSCMLMLAIVIGSTSMAANLNYEAYSSTRLGDDQPISLRFFGSTSADRFRSQESSKRSVLSASEWSWEEPYNRDLS